jgi:hypothetical protein
VRHPHLSTVLLALLTIATAACGSTASGMLPARSAQVRAQWRDYLHVRRPLDLAGPRSDGSLVLAADGRLWRVLRSRRVEPFATAYRSPGGEEPYIALATPGRTGCSFGAGTVYALRLRAPRGVVKISSSGRVRRLAALTAPGLVDGIAFDDTGRFAHRLLVTINAGSRTTVDAISCHGAVSTITRGAPRVEGGIAVAPPGFGRFGGDLIAPDETGGRIFAITPRGASILVADSGLPHGNDIGVESETFIPDLQHYSVLVADRLTPGNRHPGDDELLQIGSPALRRAGVRAGALLVASEGAAHADAISCRAGGCQVRHVADGPAIAHLEGHIAVLPR